MKILIMGTAAYERVPAMFCNCGVCQQAREIGGKNQRSQAQVLFNDDLLVDFGQDNYLHYLRNNRDYTKVENILVTHEHEDHFMPNEIAMTSGVYGHNEMKNVGVWGNQKCADLFESIKKVCKASFTVVKPYQKLKIGKYDVTSLPAYHGAVDPLCYIISDGEKTVLYNNDSGVFFDEVYDFIEKGGYRFDLVIADCTCGLLDWVGQKHMSLIDNIAHRDRLQKMGALKDNTKWIITHYSHNALFENGDPVTAERMEEIAAENGMISAFDGMEIVL